MTKPPAAALSSTVQTLLHTVRDEAERAGAFASAVVRDGMLVCQAKEAAEPAFYRLEVDGGCLWVSLVMKDRWLSESIETDLLHTGDKMEELIEEELAEQGWEDGAPVVEHFRSEDMLFTFRSPLPVELERPATSAARTAMQWLLAYEAAFRPLGDMEASDEDD